MGKSVVMGGWWAGVIVGMIGCATGPAPVAPPNDGDRMVAAVEAEKARCPGGECERACQDRGDGQACALAAELYTEGKYGHPFDAAIAFRHATRGCELGDGDACALLGQHHENGLGTPWAPALAITAYDKACNAGSGLGCLSLGLMYDRGHGVDVDRAKARSYLARAHTQLLAACQGSEPRRCAAAANALDRDEPAAKATRVALEERACDRGAVASCVDLVRDRIAHGGRPAAPAVKQIERLCAAGEATACSTVAARLAAQRAVSVAGRVLPAMIRACELGHREDCVLVATLYERGVGLARNDDLKRQYLTRACDRGSERGCLLLARDEFLRPGHEAQSAQLAQRACELGDRDGCTMAMRNKRDRNDPGAMAAAPLALDANRIAGDPNIVPDDATRRAMTLAHVSKLVGSFKLCLTDTGAVHILELLKSTGFAAYDAKIQRVIRTTWAYAPFWVDGRPMPVCTVITFIYDGR